MSNMRQITYRDAVREAMCEEMRRDESVYLMGEDIGVYCGAFGVSKGMLEEFGPERIRETPISEAAFVGAGVGSAITGMRPIVELMFSDFMAVCRQSQCPHGHPYPRRRRHRCCCPAFPVSGADVLPCAGSEGGCSLHSL